MQLQADAAGALGSEADADAVAIGFQNVSVQTDGKGDINIDVDASAGAQSDAEIISTLEADATAYGLRGTEITEETITVSGNPYAKVSAEADVIGGENSELILGNITAESVGIENADITTNGIANNWSRSQFSISASNLGSNVGGADEMREVSATAVAVEDTNIRSNDQDGSTIRGNADLNVQLDGWDNIDTKRLTSFQCRSKGCLNHNKLRQRPY